MPIHFDDVDVVSQVGGARSALIVPCAMCPAATVAVRERAPFLELFRSLVTSPPFERYVRALQSRLAEKGVRSDVFRSRLYHHWFMCMWTARRRGALRRRARGHDALIVLGCDSATETVREAAAASGCRVIEGMRVSGIMNARLGFHPPANVTFDRCRIVPISGRARDPGAAH